MSKYLGLSVRNKKRRIDCCGIFIITTIIIFSKERFPYMIETTATIVKTRLRSCILTLRSMCRGGRGSLSFVCRDRGRMETSLNPDFGHFTFMRKQRNITWLNTHKFFLFCKCLWQLVATILKRNKRWLTSFHNLSHFSFRVHFSLVLKAASLSSLFSLLVDGALNSQNSHIYQTTYRAIKFTSATYFRRRRRRRRAFEQFYLINRFLSH